jgi:hypothetical protein
MYGGLSLLVFLTGNAPGYTKNPTRHDLWRAGHARAGVYLVLSLVMLRYVDEAILSPFWKWIAFGRPTAKEPSGLMNLSLGVGLIRAARRMER